MFLPQISPAQETKNATIEERLVRLEEGQKNLEKSLEDFRSEMNTRFNDMNTRFSDMNTRFSDVNKRFDDLRFWLQFILGTVVLILGGLVAQWMLFWKRLSQVEARVDERIVLGYKEEELKEIKRRLETLEARISGQV